MIDISELMIGNRVLVDLKEAYIAQLWVDEAAIVYLHSDTGDVTPYSDIHPIPLSPELLERCGFEYYKSEGIASFSEYAREGDTHYWNLNVKKNSVLQNSHQFSLVKWGDDTEFTLSIHNLRVTVLHLHQLQNLIKTLTGKELKIK